MDIIQLKKAKKELGLTFEELSIKCGVPIQTLHNIFRGHTKNPRIDTMQAIERALGITDEPTEQQLSDKEERLLKAFSALIPPMQDYVLETVEMLVKQPQNTQKRA